ncbi:maleylpyruvate isomerase N-terminal domain-containing protein [Candidatus Viridilinea mediisalina]|nr:maleylpyruvate isomerase N-terminal domain-containing protein [Candidatus Viridilinea mediisalina]
MAPTEHEHPLDTTEELSAEEQAEREHAEAEVALARLEDRIGAFTAYTLANDFLELREIFAGSFERMKAEDWQRRSERRAQGWTRRQALAHVTAVTEAYNQAISTALAGEPVVIPGMSERSDLKAFNEAAIEARAELTVEALTTTFLDALSESASLVAPLSLKEMVHHVPLPHLSSVPTIGEMFGSSLAHAGIIHGAQLALTRARPIWIYFQPGMMRRQITRFVHLLGLNYWPERGGDLHATIAINIAGQGGGSWLIRISPSGGQGKIGRARTNDVTFSFNSADLFCRIMTFQSSAWRPLLLRRLRVAGQLGLARRVPHFFMPT